jgi:UDP-glucuronate 4-epimerase
MHALVTGAAGFIGSHLVERLLADGHSVTCVDNFDDFYDPRIKRENIAAVLAKPGVRLVEGDIREPSLLDRCFAGKAIDVVIHLAARAGVRPSLALPELYYDVNVIGTLRLLEAMRKHRVSRMIFGSSSSVYGNSSKLPCSESDNVDRPVSPYAATKKSGELLCHTFHHLYKFNVFCLRFFTVYGPRQRPEMAIHSFVQKIMNGDRITVFGDGTSKRDYTYIDDAIDGIVRSLSVVNGYEIINIGESRTVTLNELLLLLQRLLQRKAVIAYEPMQPGDVDTTFASIEKAKSLIGYNPRWTFEKGLEQFVAWLKQGESKNRGGSSFEHKQQQRT